MAEDDVEFLLGLNQAPSMNTVLRALKREESSLFCCVASIADDARFVAQVAERYPRLPVFANLRCGVWYVRPPVSHTCYFKSTDGHNGNWKFSTVRLNLHVAEAAAAVGGCLIVDATRRGKRFPDAMSKTIPTWAAVVNRAVHRLRQRGTAAPASVHAAQSPAAAPAAPAPAPAAPATTALAAGQSPPTGKQGPAAAAGETAAAEAAAAAGLVDGWDCDVHLPPWVSEVEANNIRQRLDGWVDDLLGVCPDLSALANALSKPLRCLWVSQESKMWLGAGEAADVASLAFTPIVLVGASATTARQRRCLTLPPETPGQDPLSVTYSYFPGAADDEESWACGLTHSLMWRHLRALLAAGPGGIEPLVHSLLEEQLQEQGRELQQEGERRQQQEEEEESMALYQQDGGIPGPAELTRDTGMPAAAAAAAAAPGSDEDVHLVRDAYTRAPTCQAVLHLADAHCSPAATAIPARAAGACSGAAVAAAAGMHQSAEGGLHCLLPRGCLPAQQAAVQRIGAGIYLLGDTGLAVSSAAAAAGPAVWQHVGAVLHLGVHPLPGMQQERQPAQACGAATFDANSSASGQHGMSPRAADSTQPCAAAAAPDLPGETTAALGSCRFCWLAVQSSKEDRYSLQQQLPTALAFAQAHLQRGRRLLLCCDSGLDASVCMAVACLLAFYQLEQRPGTGGGLLPVWAGQEVDQQLAGSADARHALVNTAANGALAGCAGSVDCAVKECGSSQSPGLERSVQRFPPAAGAAAFKTGGKLAVRQHLAAVSAHYPSARPTRGMLKQVFNFFLAQGTNV